jgi:hypothetical protein
MLPTVFRDAGLANLNDLAPFNVTQAMLDDLGKARVDFLEAKTKPRSKIGEKAGCTATLGPMLHDAMSLVRLQLDKLMASFRLSQPAFYAGYLSARVIIDRHGQISGEQLPAAPKP